MHAEAKLLHLPHKHLITMVTVCPISCINSETPYVAQFRTVVTSQATECTGLSLAIFGLRTATVAASPHTKTTSAGHGQSAVPHFTQEFRNVDLQRLNTFSNYSSTQDKALLETGAIPLLMLPLKSSEECVLFVLYSFSDNSLNNDVRVNLT